MAGVGQDQAPRRPRADSRRRTNGVAGVRRAGEKKEKRGRTSGLRGGAPRWLPPAAAGAGARATESTTAPPAAWSAASRGLAQRAAGRPGVRGPGQRTHDGDSDAVLSATSRHTRPSGRTGPPGLRAPGGTLPAQDAGRVLSGQPPPAGHAHAPSEALPGGGRRRQGQRPLGSRPRAGVRVDHARSLKTRRKPEGWGTEFSGPFFSRRRQAQM